jgi:hypothetical protein
VQLALMPYDSLNARQKELRNYFKLASALADYGYFCMLLHDDWNGADVLARHADGTTVIAIQLKARLEVNEKYAGKELWIAFPDGDDWLLLPHDELQQLALANTNRSKGTFSTGRLPARLRVALAPYRLSRAARVIEPSTAD